MKVFSELCIVEIAGAVSGAYAGKLFADYGATVLLVEPPQGSPMRDDGVPWNGTGSAFAFNNTSKQSLTLDASNPKDGAQLEELLRGADVVIESSSPNPLTPVSAEVDAPQLVRAYLSPFGLSGPRASWRSSPFTDFALSGHMFLTGEPDREPLQGPPLQSEYAAGAQAFYGIMAALWARERIGKGQTVEVSLVESLANLHQYTTVMWTHGHHIQTRVGNSQPGPWHPNGHLPCQDGWVSICSPGRERLTRTLAVMDHLHLLEDPRFQEEEELLKHRSEFDAAIAPWLETRPAQTIADALQELRIPAAPVHTMREVLDYDHLRARDFWRSLPGGAEEADIDLTLPRGPFTIAGFDLAPAPPPALNSATSETLARFQKKRATPAPATPAPATPDDSPGAGPLDGVRILDLTAGWAGPLAARILADLGADVIKIEPPWGRGPRSVSRAAAEAVHFYPDNDPGNEPWNRNGIVNKHNRNRRGMTLRLDQPEGRAAAERILRTCDVLLENFTPGVMQRLGLTDQRLREINPRLVHVAMPGWGLDGPHHHYAALGPMVEAASGQCMLMGYRDSIPYRQGMAFPDAISGIHAPGSLLLALWQATAEPDVPPPFVENAQLEATVMFNGHALLDAQLTDQEPPRLGNRHPEFAPQGVYPCLPATAHGDGDQAADKWLALSITADDEWRTLCDLATLDPAWRDWTRERRREQHDAIDAAITAWSRRHRHVALMETLQAHGIIAAAVLNAAEMIDDAHLQNRQFWVDVEQPVWGRAFPFAALPVHFSDTPATYRLAGPTLGEHNHEVLHDVAGLSDAEIDALAAAGIISSEPPE
ncbi:MAG TPA: CoA transferase [Dehalococcoidia bacterium]|nr:CoA transferase [Dehalococcoidia bacterium]